ncbi:MAG: Flp pilus assembly complex ATPase component TadA, partial [Candidatus Omnitrophica bacterium]|nr:Flp pilus assembly complex ATPase component TadA [Candidatus Omnitrophota bacterium]
MPPTLKERLTKILIDKKLIKESDLDKAVSLQKEKGGSLSDILVNLGLISKNDLLVALSQELGIPPINLSRYRIDPTVIKLIPKKTAKHYKILPISKVKDSLTVAMADPLNIFAIDDIKALTGFKINPVITTDKDMNDAIAQYYEESAYTAIEKIVEDMKESAEIKMVEESAEETPISSDLLRMTQEAPVVKITNLLLAEGVSARSSDILIEPLEHEVRVRNRIDGILHEAKRIPKSLHSAIVSRLKVMSDLNIAERRLPQDGRFKIRLAGREIDFRISVLPSSKGEKVALRILDKSQAMLDIEKLGFDQISLEGIKKDSKKPHGMILICGPTGCGKTTTLYSILELINSPEKNIVTVEDPIEYIIEGINQVTARPDIGLTFAGALRSILRQDPNVIMIGEIRDLDTVDIAIKAALTGHLVLSTLHTTTATGSITRLVNMGVEPFLITSSLILVGAQRLVRKICHACKESYTLNEDIAEKLKIKVKSVKAVFYRGKGCEAGRGTGYKGRLGLIEILSLRPKIKALILEGAQEHEIRETARLEGMKTL